MTQDVLETGRRAGHYDVDEMSAIDCGNGLKCRVMSGIQWRYKTEAHADPKFGVLSVRLESVGSKV